MSRLFPPVPRAALQRRLIGALVASLLAVGTPAMAAGPDPDTAIADAIAARAKGDFAAARKLLTAVLAANAEHARALHELAVLHAIFGELSDAAALFKRALQADPAMTASRKNLAEVLRAAGRFSEALPHFKALQDHAPSRDVALRGIAICEEAMGRPENAVAALDALAKTHKDDDMARWVKQQRALLVAGRADAGISVGAAEAEGDAHFKDGRHQHAAHWYALACRKGPTADRCYKHAVALLAVRDFLGAVGALRKALKRDPGHMPSLSAWPTAVRKLRGEGGGAQVVELSKQKRAATLRAAKALVDGDLLLARRIAVAARGTPQHGVVLELIEAESLLRDGYPGPAEKILRRVLRTKPKHPVAAQALADVMFQRGRPEAARHLAALPRPMSAPLSAPDDVRAAYGSPTRDLASFSQWRRAAFDRRLRMLLDPGVKPPHAFSFQDAIDPESVRAAPVVEPPRPAPKRRRRRR